MRSVVRTLTAVFLALAGPVLAAPAVRAYAQETQQSSRTDAAASHQLSISIDGVTPNFATPASTVTVTGTLTNHTGSAIPGIVVQLLTSPYQFHTRSDMDSFASGSSLTLYQEGTTYSLNVANGATVRWTVSLSAAQAQYSVFGVYPLEVVAASPFSSYQAADHTFLPFWPDSGRPSPLDAAWIWPLIDQPQQGACSQTLATNSLAGSLGTGGRLGRLLVIGQQWAQPDHLTWAVDPALLSDANVMTHRYKVGGDAACTGAARMPASATAGNWLSLLRTGSAGDEMFLTPYADADVSALTHAGLDGNLRTAYRLGKSVAGKILPRTFGKNGTAADAGAVAAIAWPADGIADASVITSLASNGGINTVVLNSGELPSIDGQFDNALGVTTAGADTRMRVLLADSQLTAILGSASAGSPADSRFAAEQDFLAQTAMITAEAPNKERSIVIAPPRHWDPSAAEAATLLSLTYGAPWLHKVDLASLAAADSRLPAREPLPANQVSKAELGNGYLDRVRAVDVSAALYKNLLYQPGAGRLAAIDEAVAATTSAAWRGAGSAGGRLALTQLSDYLANAEKQVKIITGKKVLLAGTSGNTPVSVQNLLSVPVQVRVVATVPPGSQLSVGKFGDDNLLMVPAMKTVTAGMPVHSTAIGTTTMQLQLVTKDGSPLTWTAQTLSVQVTRYGRALLVLIGAALGVLVLTSVARWIRRWLNDGRTDGRAGGTG